MGGGMMGGGMGGGGMGGMGGMGGGMMGGGMGGMGAMGGGMGGMGGGMGGPGYGGQGGFGGHEGMVRCAARGARLLRTHVPRNARKGRHSLLLYSALRAPVCLVCCWKRRWPPQAAAAGAGCDLRGVLAAGRTGRTWAAWRSTTRGSPCPGERTPLEGSTLVCLCVL